MSSIIINKLILKIITALHLLFVLFMIIVPFTNSTYFLLLHAIMTPFIMVHWVTNNNMCALTMAEQTLRREIYGSVNENDCITCKIINPVYDFKNNFESFSTLIYIITGSLWLISMYKLYKKYKNSEIRCLDDLFAY